MRCPATGRPWIPWFTGTGHVWPLLNSERGEYALQAGDPSGAGQPAGSAGEITWAEASYVRLARDIAADALGDQPSIVADRYVKQPPPAQAPLTLTVPAAATTPTVTVTGTAAPGATVVLAATLSPAGSTEPNGTAHSAPVPTNLVTARVGPDGTFTAALPSPAGTWMISAATATQAATGFAQATLVSSG